MQPRRTAYLGASWHRKAGTATWPLRLPPDLGGDHFCGEECVALAAVVRMLALPRLRANLQTRYQVLLLLLLCPAAQAARWSALTWC